VVVEFVTSHKELMLRIAVVLIGEYVHGDL